MRQLITSTGRVKIGCTLVIAFGLLFLLTGLTSFSGRKVSLPDDVLDYTNQFRKENGLAPLVMKEDLNIIAETHSKNMASGKTPLGHKGVEKRQAEATKQIGDVNAFAENVAFGASSGQDVVNMWKNSPGHRRNMLGNYKYIGIGTAKDKKGNIYFTQVFVD